MYQTRQGKGDNGREGFGVPKCLLTGLYASRSRSTSDATPIGWGSQCNLGHIKSCKGGSGGSRRSRGVVGGRATRLPTAISAASGCVVFALGQVSLGLYFTGLSSGDWKPASPSRFWLCRQLQSGSA